MEEEFSEASSEQTGDTSVAEEVPSQGTSVEGVEQEASTSKSQEPSQVPLNDPKNPYFDRFSELTSQNREFKGKLSDYDSTIRQLQQQLTELKASAPKPQAPESPYKPLLDQLEQANPEFARFQRDLIARAEAAENKAKLAEQAISRLDQYEARTTQAEAVSKFNSLLETNKVPPSLRPRYEREVSAMVYDLRSKGHQVNVKDIDQLFTNVHTEYTKFLEDFKRQERASYVQEKKKDAAPSSTTGGAPVVPGMKKIAANDIEGQVKWLAEGLRKAKQL